MHQHHNQRNVLLDYPVSKVVCVGGNYASHIKEMGGSTPEESVLFIRPEIALCDLRQLLVISSDMGSVHHEVEPAVLIGAILRRATEEHVRKAITGYGVVLGLTLRDTQDKTKKVRQSWEKAKGSDNFCPLPGLIPIAEFNDGPQDMILGLTVNSELRQRGTTVDMIYHIVLLIAHMSRFLTLKAGNVVLTGTPAGAKPLNSGGGLAISFHGQTPTTRVP